MNTISSPAATLRSGISRRVSRSSRVGLLAVADGLTRPGLRAANVRLRRLLGRPVLPDASAGAGSPESLDQSLPASQDLVGGADLRFYHRAGCPMAAGRDWPATSAAEHSEAGRAPCGMCRP